MRIALNLSATSHTSWILDFPSRVRETRDGLAVLHIDFDPALLDEHELQRSALLGQLVKFRSANMERRIISCTSSRCTTAS